MTALYQGRQYYAAGLFLYKKLDGLLLFGYNISKSQAIIGLRGLKL